MTSRDDATIGNEKLARLPGTRYALEGELVRYFEVVTDNWIKTAPYANPGMLEMLRDRERKPYRKLLPWSGWFAGMYLLSSVQVLRVTGEPALEKHLEWFVAELLSLQAEDGYLGCWPRGFRFLNRAPNVGGHEGLTWDTSAHYFLMLGLLLWHEDTGDAAALAAVRKIADGLCRLYLREPGDPTGAGGSSPDRNRGRRLVETGYSEMNLAPAHSLALLFRATGEERYLRLARQIVDEEFGAAADGGEPLAGDYLEAGLQGRDFYTLSRPRWESLHPMMAMAELYHITGEERYRKAFEHFWWSMVRTDRHNNGGFTTGEKAVGSPYAHGAIESCCTIAWTAYSVETLRLTGNPIVADELELTTLNSIIGMHSFTGRWSTYSTPMDGVRKASTHDISFQARAGTPELNCCSVNTPRGFGLLSDWALMRDEAGLVLNYYGPGSMTVELEDGVTVELRQTTDYPVSGAVALAVIPSREVELELQLRVPQWSRDTRIRVNGSDAGAAEPGSYFPIKRTWKKGDGVQLDLDMSYHFWSGEEACLGKVSVYRGPILLTYDRRFNDMDPDEIPALDARSMEDRLVEFGTWIGPMMLLEVETPGGRKLRLCDFGSAGEAGSPYRSWLVVENAPKADFSPTNTLRTARPSSGSGRP